MGRMRLFAKNSFSNYIIGFIIVFIILQLIIIFFTISYSVKVIKDQTTQTAKNILNVYANDIINSLNEVDADLRDILYEDSALKLLSNPAPNSRYHAMYNILQVMKTCLNSNEGIDSYLVFNRDYDNRLIVRSTRMDYSRLETIEDYVGTAFENTGLNDSSWQIIHLDDEAFLGHYYYLGSNIVMALIKVSTLGNMYQSVFEENQGLIITDLSGNPQLQVGSYRLGQQCFPLDNSITYQHGNRHRYTMITQSMEPYPLRLSYVMKPDFIEIVQAAPILIVLTGAGALLFIAAFIIYVNQEIIFPMNQLIETAQIIESGDMDYRTGLQCRNVEFHLLSRAINSMLDMIVQARIESYEQVIKQQDTELKYLHMQIRPHFFLNTLSSIYSMSYKNDNKRIQTFINSVSKNIRYMFQAGLHTVTVRREVEHIENYLCCQEMLYPRCVFSYIELQPEAEQMEIPQMLIHTFVENVYKHVVSVDNLISLFIRVSIVEQQGRRMLIEVEDDGAGFPQEVMDRINMGTFAEDNEYHGVGLENMARTLLLMYGKQGLLSLSNKESGGGLIRVYIPILEEDKSKDDAVNGR